MCKYKMNIKFFSPTFFLFLYLKSAIKIIQYFVKSQLKTFCNFKELIRNENEKMELKYVFKIMISEFLLILGVNESSRPWA